MTAWHVLGDLSWRTVEPATEAHRINRSTNALVPVDLDMAVVNGPLQLVVPIGRYQSLWEKINIPADAGSNVSLRQLLTYINEFYSQPAPIEMIQRLVEAGDEVYDAEEIVAQGETVYLKELMGDLIFFEGLSLGLDGVASLQLGS